MFLDPKIEVTEDDVRKALKAPRDFGSHGDDDLFVTWSLGPLMRHRDSSLLDESNADALIKHLESDPTLADDWCVKRCSHWAVGWVDHLSFRAVEADGAPTRIFRVLMEWNALLSNYPVADDEDFSRREYAATIANIESEGERLTSTDAPKDWPAKVFSWLWDNDQREVEAVDGGGGYSSREAITAALTALGFACPK